MRQVVLAATVSTTVRYGVQREKQTHTPSWWNYPCARKVDELVQLR